MIDASKFFLGRQPILDRTQNLSGYELQFRCNQNYAAQFQDDDTLSSLVINHSYNELGLQAVLGKYRGYIKVSKNILMSDMIELLPKGQMVFELLGNIVISDDVVERCKRLKSMGYTLALDDLSHHDVTIEPLRGVIDIIKVDIEKSDPAWIEAVASRLKKWPVKLLAKQVNSRETAKLCFDHGFNLFQGYYFSKPVVISGKRLSHSELELIRLIGLVMSEADTGKIEQVFKENPGLSFSLLRLTNSAAFAHFRKITSISHAIMELGRRQLLQWLQMLLFAIDKNAVFPNPLLQLAATRGKFMELMARQLEPNNKDFEDQAYMVGIMSLMDALLGMPLAEILSPLNAPYNVSDALLFRSGRLGTMLQLIEQLESNVIDSASLSLEQLAPLNIAQVNAAQVEALTWANRIGHEV